MPLRSKDPDQRLWLACGLAALLHMALLFGLHLSSEPYSTPSLKVTLVAVAGGPAPLNAQVLAPVSQIGGGSRQELRAPSARAGGPLELAGLRHAAELDMQSAEQPGERVRTLSTESASDWARSDSEALQTGVDADLRLLRREHAGSSMASPERRPIPQSTSDDSRRNAAGASTRASQQAAYRELWRQRVEHAGSANFPWSALATGQPKSLTLLVTVRADGTVTQTRVQRSSGLPMLDKAALQILRLAGPFPPFPERLRQETEELSFAYDWEFFPGDRAALRVGRP